MAFRPATAETRASKRRAYVITAVALALNMVSYIDRVCISVAGPSIRSEFHLSPTQLGIVFGTFSLSYALLQAPWGMAADRFGARSIVTFAITGWSAFTALTAAAWSYVSLLAIRLIFGGLEAALSPSIAAAFARAIPASGRSTAFGIFTSGGRLGGAIAPAIAAAIILRYGWRTSFVAFAGLGLIAAACWWLLTGPEHGTPVEKPRPVRRKIVFTVPLFSLLFVAFGYTFMWQFYATWFPTYLMERRGFTLREAGAYAGVPFLLGAIANWVGGFLADRLTRTYGASRGRGALGLGGLLASAAFLCAGIVQARRGVAAILIATAAGFGDLFLGAAWASAVDIGGESAGAVSGLMNSASNLAGFVSPIVLAAAFERTGSWDAVLFVSAAANVVSAIVWLGVNRGVRPSAFP